MKISPLACEFCKQKLWRFNKKTHLSNLLWGNPYAPSAFQNLSTQKKFFTCTGCNHKIDNSIITERINRTLIEALPTKDPQS